MLEIYTKLYCEQICTVAYDITAHITVINEVVHFNKYIELYF